MAKNDVSVSNNFYKAVAKRAYMRESVKRKRQNKEFRETKTMQNTKKDLKILKQQGNMKSKHFTRVKFPIQNISENSNRKAQKNLREAMQSSRLNQAEICQGQDSTRHSMSKVIQSFCDR